MTQDNIAQILDYNSLVLPYCTVECDDEFLTKIFNILDDLAHYCWERDIRIRVQSITESGGKLAFKLGHSGLNYYLGDHDDRIEEILEKHDAASN